MSLPRFFVDLPLVADNELALPADIAHHAVRVLRLQDGDALIMFNGRGGEYPAQLRVQGRQASVALGSLNPREAELPVPVTLVQGIASGDKMDWIIEKAVEMGASAVQPVAATRSVLRLSGDRLEKRMAHWRRVAIAACEQSGRNRIPEVAVPLTLPVYLANAPTDCLRLLCDPAADARLTDLIAQRDLSQGIALLVGPEGGWSKDELEAATRHGVDTARFGDRVLRTETAGTALIAALSARLGWV